MFVEFLFYLLNISEPTSRHLKVLRERSMVNHERDGVHVYYSLADQRIIEALDLLRSEHEDYPYCPCFSPPAVLSISKSVFEGWSRAFRCKFSGQRTG